VKLCDAARGDLPRDHFDPDAVARSVGPVPTAVADWVRANTSFVPYRGALRGAAGVLMDRCGNHLDRALLAARLLKATGHEVRLARYELSAAQAEAVLKDTWEHAAAPAAAPPPDPEKRRAQYARWSQASGIPVAQIEAWVARAN